VKISAHWQRQIEAAQHETTVDLIGGIYTRLRYGMEPIASGLHCRDCATLTGQFHVIGCAVERCPRCGGQAISCPDCIPRDADDEGGDLADMVAS
jgi:hypothetical protein